MQPIWLEDWPPFWRDSLEEQGLAAAHSECAQPLREGWEAFAPMAQARPRDPRSAGFLVEV